MSQKSNPHGSAPPRRTNEARSAHTRQALIDAARQLFIDNGFAATSTPEIVTMAQVTRGALYHHFADKTDLFKSVVHAEAQAVAQEINRNAAQPESALGALLDGANGYFIAMAKPGRARLLLIEGPAVLGPDTMSQLNSDTSTATLADGLAQAMRDAHDINATPIKELAEVLGSGFDRAALAVAGGESVEPYQQAFRLLFERLVSK
ncbi:MAG: TetR/AcrR family transcriptional regulator [Burkholderiaceae bacterium]